jgi:hypothetical protein
MPYQSLTNKRIQEAQRSSAMLDKLVRAAQSALYGLLIEWIAGKIETEGGRIKYSASNLGKVASIYVIMRRWQRSYERDMLGGVLGAAARILGLNSRYFGEMRQVPESVDDAARRLVLQRWGYNVSAKALIPGGYFEKLFANEGVARNVASLVNRAIAAKMPMDEFQRQFRKVFVGSPGGGMLERHWKTNSFDLFQKIDRAANLVYADRLGLNYAIYSGTVMDTTRHFCEQRVNRVFSRKEIESWKNLNWQGKIQIGYDPYLDLGGFNCRHHLSFISNEIAQTLRPDIANA